MTVWRLHLGQIKNNRNVLTLHFCRQISGAAPGVSAVGQTTDVLPQCTAPQYRRAGSSQSQASRRHQLPPAGQHHHHQQQQQQQQQRREEQQRNIWAAVQHTGREDGWEGTNSISSYKSDHFTKGRGSQMCYLFSVIGAEDFRSNFLFRTRGRCSTQWLNLPEQ